MLLKILTTTILSFFLSAGSESDYTIYSVLTYNFIKYTEWPASSQEVSIAVFNNEEATASMAKMAKIKTTQSLAIAVKNVVNENELSSYQVIFIPSNSSSKCQKIVEQVKGLPILIITEDPDLIKQGSSISFKMIDGKSRFQINKSSLTASGLKMASVITNLGIN